MISAGAAIRLGFTRAASRWATGLFAVLATVAEVFAGVIAMLAGFAWLEGHEKSPPVALAAAVVAVLGARIMLAFVQGGAIRQSAGWLKGQGTGTSLEEMFAAAPRSLGWFLWTLPIEILAALWKWVGAFALVWAYVRALLHGSGGFSASLALSMFIVLSVPLAIGWALLKRAALVAAVTDDLGPLAAATRALGSVAMRPLSYLAVVITGVAGAAVAEMILSLFGSAVSPSDFLALEPTIAGQLAVGMLVAFVSALFELMILHGFTALKAEPAQPAPESPAVALAA